MDLINGIVLFIGGDLFNGMVIDVGFYGFCKKEYIYWNDGVDSDNCLNFGSV